jgi:hypothetical protein
VNVSLKKTILITHPTPIVRHVRLMDNLGGHVTDPIFASANPDPIPLNRLL